MNPAPLPDERYELPLAAAQMAKLIRQGPVGEGAPGKLFEIGGQPMNKRLQAYCNVVRPSGALIWTLQFHSPEVAERLLGSVSEKHDQSWSVTMRSRIFGQKVGVRVTAIAFGFLIAGAGAVGADTIDTRVGKLEFTHDFANGYPTDETVEKLFEEMDFQRAVQAYIWSLPLVSWANWQHVHETEFGAKSGDLVLYVSIGFEH